MPVKVNIIIKGKEGALFKKSYLHYSDSDGELTLSLTNNNIAKMVQECRDSFKEIPDEIIVKSEFLWN